MDIDARGLKEIPIPKKYQEIFQDYENMAIGQICNELLEMMSLEAFEHEEMKGVVQIEEVEDIEEARDGVTLCQYLMEGAASNNFMNPTFVEEDMEVQSLCF